MRDFRSLLGEGRLLHASLTYDPVSARLAEEAGFDALLVGGAITGLFGYGLPDGTIEIGDVIAQARRVRALCDVPIILDIDDAGGAPPAVQRYVRMSEDAGATAILVEDDDCSNRYRWEDSTSSWQHEHFRLRPIDAAAEVIRLAVRSRRSERTAIIARTDAMGSTGLGDSMDRARAFVANGADAVFIYMLPPDQVPAVTEELGVPVMNLVSAPPTPVELEALVTSGLRLAVHTSVMGDPFVATRSAVVRAASAIQKIEPGILESKLPETLWAASQNWAVERVAD